MLTLKNYIEVKVRYGKMLSKRYGAWDMALIAEDTGAWTRRPGFAWCACLPSSLCFN